MSSGTAGLAPAFRAKVDALVAASHGRVTVVSGYRTYNEQLALRKVNGCPDVLRSPSSACRKPTAIPGTSLHEKGLAVDFGGDVALASRLAPQFGLVAKVSGDPNHYEAADTSLTGVPQTGGGATQGAVDAVAGVGAADGVDGLLGGLRKVLLGGLFVGGGLALLAAGLYRATTGRSLARDGVKAGAAVATGGASLAAPRSAP